MHPPETPTATTEPQRSAPASVDWWRDAVVYQIYVRSFRDASGDGIGDLAGIQAGLGHLAELGVDAIWLNPCYPSPQRDHGYDISDYFGVDEVYGALDDLERLVEAAHARGIRVLMDVVANHCSSDHPWFRAALASDPGSVERARFLFRDGRGSDGELPPNNWQSVFGGSAWTRVVERDGRPGQWYLHSFDSGQPDFDWRNADVADHFDRVLRFWFDRGVDGFRIDVGHGGFKSVGLEDWPGAEDGTGGHNYAMWDQPEVHETYRSWRALGERYEPPRSFIGEIWVPSPDRLAAYVRDDELHQAFNFDLLVQPWDAERLRRAVETGLRVATPAWVLSNHDVHRTVTRLGQEQVLDPPDPADLLAAARHRGPVDLRLGRRRARAAAALLLALPGAAYLYQGEELGLPEVFDLPDEARQDPIWLRSGGAELGRDGCRVPLPWSTEAPSFGFSPPDAAPTWLPQPSWFGEYAVSVQRAEPASTLQLYRELIAQRRGLFGTDSTITWLPDAAPGVLAFARGSGACVVNLAGHPVALPEAWGLGDVVVTSTGAHGSGDLVLPSDSAAWFALSASRVDADTDATSGFSTATPTTATPDLV